MSQPRNEGLPRSVTHALEAITCSQRALAYLQVDAELTLVGAGGNLGTGGVPLLRWCGVARDSRCCPYSDMQGSGLLQRELTVVPISLVANPVLIILS